MSRLKFLAVFSLVFFIACVVPVYADTASPSVSRLSSHESGRLFTLKGSNTIGARLAPTWVKAWLEAKGLTDVVIKPTRLENEYRVEGYNGDLPVFVDLHAHGSGTGYQGLLDGSAQIAMSSRSIKESEVTMLARLGNMQSFDAENVVAIDGLAVIVNRANPVDALTIDEIARLFSGEIKTWSELGGADLPVKIYARDNKSGTWDTFKSLVLNKPYSLSASAQRFESNDQLSDTLSADPGGIGFVGLASVRNAKAIAVSDNYTDPLFPEPLYVATEDYPLARRLYMYTPPQQRNPLVNEFLSYVQSVQGQEIVNRVGFVSQNPVRVSSGTPAMAPERYQVLSNFGQRLSVNFRFNANSAELDNKARQDVLRLVRFMENPANKNLRIQLVGFGDLKQDKRRALVLSKLRAVGVKTALYNYGVATESVMGMGMDFPVAANIGRGKLRNQRVEVWVYDDEHHEAMLQAKKGASRKKRQEATTEIVLSN